MELATLLGVGIAPFYLDGFYNSPLAVHRSAFWMVDVLTWIVMPTVLLGWGLRRGLYTASELGLTMKVRGSERPWLFWILFFCVLFAFWRLNVAVVVWAHSSLPPGWELPPFRYVDVIPPPGPDTGWYRLLALAYLCVTAGMVEELYCRAAMDRLFPRGVVGGSCYVFVSSAVFAGAHWEGGIPNVVEALAFGLLASTTFRLTGNLWPLIAEHIVTDWYWFSGVGVVG